MSVAPLTAQEFGCFVAIAHKHLKAGSIAELCRMAALTSSGNAGAYSAQYGEPLEPATAEEIEAIALDYLADRRDMVADHFGPLAYNMVANDGSVYIAPGVETAQGKQLLAALATIEKAARKWQEVEQSKLQRAEENAVAYNEVGQLKTYSKAEIEARKLVAKADRIIVAEFCVDESDIQTDYFGGRTGRRVVIGFAKGKRENFKQLRKAAGQFPPTSHMGPDKDIFKCRVVFTNDVISNGYAYWKGSYSHWHDDDGNGEVFATQAEADAFVASKGEPHSIGFGGTTGNFAWAIECDSYEQRENYSMGGGNYLGTSRYGGWKVRSYERLYDGRYEVWEG